MSNKPSAKSSLKPSPKSAAKSAPEPPPRDGFLLKNGTLVEDPLFLFLLTQIGYRAAELKNFPGQPGVQPYIGSAWTQRKREIADKLKAEVVTVADDGFIRSDDDNNESEDNNSIPDPNESEEHRAKRSRIYQEGRKTLADRDELEHERGEARRERVRAIMAARDEEERQRNEAGRVWLRGNR